MFRKLLSVMLVVVIGASIAACGSGSGDNSTGPVLGDAAFNLVDLVLNSDNIFVVAKDSILIGKDAIKLVQTIPANQSPSTNAAAGHIRVAIHYIRNGVDSQDVYDLKTGKARLGILLEGGTTFESISANNVEIDATQTHQISIVPLQNGTSYYTLQATSGWVNTGVFLERGKQFNIKYYSGLWTISKGKVGTSDAAGQPVNPPSNLICNCGEPLPGFSTQGLVGRVGQGLDHAPLQVGDDFAGVSYDNDFLYLRINLADSLLRFANGSIKVAIETENAS